MHENEAIECIKSFPKIHTFVHEQLYIDKKQKYL